MKKNVYRRKIFFAFSLLFFTVFCAGAWAQADSSQVSEADYLSMPQYSRLSSLLTGWLSNDLELQKKTLEAKSKALSLKSTQISNGFDIQLSSGAVTVQTDISGSTTVYVNPSVSVDFPAAADSGLDFDLTYRIEDGKKTVTDGSLSLTADIVSSSVKERKITLLEAERELTQAKRAVEDRAVKAEKEFYENLKKLYNYAVSIHTAKNDLYDDETDLRVLETKGYSKTSASYRQQALKVESGRRDVMEKQRILERETAVFALKCGKEFTRISGTGTGKESAEKRSEAAYEAVLAFLPDAVPAVKNVKIFDFKREDYVSIESAEWDKYIAQLKRDADRDLTVSATGEYIFNSSTSYYDDAGGRLNFNWKGLTASAGAYVPTGRNAFGIDDIYKTKQNDNPYFQFSLAISPNEWRLSKIEKEQDKIDIQKEKIAVQAAVDEYESAVLEKVSTFHDIKWSQASYAEEYDMYTKLEQDMAKWLEQGLVTKNDYLDALNSREKARINTMINAIDLIIFNDEVKLLFHDSNSSDVKNGSEKTAE